MDFAAAADDFGASPKGRAAFPANNSTDWEATLRAGLSDPDPNVRREMQARLVQMTPGLASNFAANGPAAANAPTAQAANAPRYDFGAAANDFAPSSTASTAPVVVAAPVAVAPVAPDAPSNRAGGLVEPILSMATGTLAAPFAGVAGLVRTLLPGPPGAGAATSQAIQDAMTYQPKTAEGIAASNAIGKGVKAVGDFATQPVQSAITGTDINPLSLATKVPGALADAGYPGLATAARVLPDAAMALAAPEFRGLLRSALPEGEAASAAASASRVEPSFRPVTNDRAPGVATEYASPPGSPPLKVTISGTADSPIKLDEASPELQAAVKQAGSNVNPVALNRHLEADSLPLKMQLTEGQATGDVNILSNEANKRPGEVAQRYNEQNGQIIQNLDAIKAKVSPDVTATDAASLGQNRVDAYKTMDAKRQDDISAKYQALQDANGGQFPIDGPTLVKSANDSLTAQGKARFLPSEVKDYLNDYGDGSTPMTFNDFENMRTTLAAAGRKAARSGDGNAEGAINIVRNQVESLPMTNETAKLKPLADSARAAARERFQAISNDPAYKAAVNDTAGVNEPSPLADTFVQKYIANAPAAHVGRMLSNLASDPLAKQEVAAGLVDHVKAQSGVDLRTGTGNVSQSAYNKTIGARGFGQKLDMALDPTSAQHVRTLGNVARYTQEQPRGSYVNNSNTTVAATAANAVARAAEGIVNVKSGGLPVGTGIRYLADKALDGKREAARVKRALEPGAGLTVPLSSLVNK